MKTKMLHLFASVILMLSVSTTCFAVDPKPITSANEQLRHIFEYVVSPDPDVLFLYQLSAHIIDSAYFDTQCPLTTNCDTWFYAYKELRWCAYDTTWMESDTSVYMRACDVYSDTITFGILDWEYNSLDYDAFYSTDYFDFDLTNNQLIPYSPTDASPYVVGEIFMSSPLLFSSQTNTPVFKVDPSFVFADLLFFDELGGLYRLFIDFDDGNGPQQINLSTTTYHTITYNVPGYHVLKTTIRQANDTSVIIKSSNSGFKVDSTPAISTQDYTNLSSQFQGLKVYQFDPTCDMGNLDDKIIFILAGYYGGAILKYLTRDVAKLYDDYVRKGDMEILRQFGYTFVLVEWEDADRAIEDNAAYVMSLLEYYKCNKVGDEQFVLIGESMGALVGRYALTYMESPYYVSPNDCCLNLKHNVRLFISNDGPHLGANIPLSIQELYFAAKNYFEFKEYLGDILSVTALSILEMSNRSLNGAAVKQMLLYHCSTDNYGSYTAHQYHEDFFDDLEDIGGYPHLCKNVALSNGSLLGYNQQECFDSSDAGNFRVANDDLFEYYNTLEFHVLGVTLETTVSAELKTNPNGNGPLISLIVNSAYPTINIYWFGIDIIKSEDNIVSLSKNGVDLMPYCVSAGGAVWANKSGYAGEFSGPNFDFGGFLFGLHMSSQPGDWSMTIDHGIPWLFGGSATIGIHTDGLGFCLVPVQSAFCYDPGNWDLQKDYTNLTTTTMFGNTFFDVLSGRPDCDLSYRYNGLHKAYRNEEFTNQITNSSSYYHYFRINGDGPCEVTESRILNREIGDEELFLDNCTIYNTVSYSSLIQIYVSAPHPYYNFDGQINTTYKIRGMYSRTCPFQTLGAGLAVLYTADYPDTHYADCLYDYYQTEFLPCCENLISLREDGKKTNSVTISPNPVSIGERMEIATTSLVYGVKLYDATGLFIADLPVLSDDSGTIFVTIPVTIPLGFYNLTVENEEGVTTSGLFIK